jgi:DNA-directed RNA polymerase specialized sigma54-like protein
VKQSLSYIRRLDPRPGLPYFSQQKKYIEPDAVVQKDQILMNDAGLPRVSIHTDYKGLKEVSENQEVKALFQLYKENKVLD